MRALFFCLLLTSALLTFGCAGEGPTAEEVGEQFRRGARGEGRLGPVDRSDDPYVRGREPEVNH